jgi:hypothetical protein
LKEKLDMAILNDKKFKNKGRLNVSKDSSKTIWEEIAVFEEEETRGSYMQNSYEYLKTKPTSVESKRGFSASGNFVTSPKKKCTSQQYKKKTRDSHEYNLV